MDIEQIKRDDSWKEINRKIKKGVRNNYNQQSCTWCADTLIDVEGVGTWVFPQYCEDKGDVKNAEWASVSGAYGFIKGLKAANVLDPA